MHYSDLQSFKLEITLICGDLRFSGRPSLSAAYGYLPTQKKTQHTLSTRLLKFHGTYRIYSFV